MKYLHKLKILTFFIATTSTVAMAEESGVTLYSKYYCNLCHGEDAAHPTQNDYPKLAGQNVQFLYNQLLSFKYKRRTNDLAELMIPMVEIIPDRELKIIAQYISTINSGKWLDDDKDMVSVGQERVVTASELNVRSMASINGEAIRTIKQGTKVTVLEIEGSWAKISEGEWVWSNFLK